MKEFNGRVAVITGGASGIGRAIAERFAEEGMKIVLADIEVEALKKAEAEMKADGAKVMAIATDVSKSADMEALAAKVFETYGTVHILCNNAGVATAGPAWEISAEDWDWVLGVNLFGVIHGIRNFVPTMCERGEEGHIINVASMAGLTTGAGMAPYYVSKHGVVALSESLHHEFLKEELDIRVSVLCPGWVDTRILDADRNRPTGLVEEDNLHPMAKQLRDIFRENLPKGLPPKEVAAITIQAVIDKTFYVLPHPELKDRILSRMEGILEGRDPTTISPPED